MVIGTHHVEAGEGVLSHLATCRKTQGGSPRKRGVLQVLVTKRILRLQTQGRTGSESCQKTCSHPSDHSPGKAAPEPQ